MSLLLGDILPGARAISNAYKIIARRSFQEQNKKCTNLEYGFLKDVNASDLTENP